jgi:hypothetical protein
MLWVSDLIDCCRVPATCGHQIPPMVQRKRFLHPQHSKSSESSSLSDDLHLFSRTPANGLHHHATAHPSPTTSRPTKPSPTKTYQKKPWMTWRATKLPSLTVSTIVDNKDGYYFPLTMSHLTFYLPWVGPENMGHLSLKRSASRVYGIMYCIR